MHSLFLVMYYIANSDRYFLIQINWPTNEREYVQCQQHILIESLCKHICMYMRISLCHIVLLKRGNEKKKQEKPPGEKLQPSESMCKWITYRKWDIKVRTIIHCTITHSIHGICIKYSCFSWFFFCRHTEEMIIFV